MKILNLYAGIGGNRKLWGDNHEIVAIEYKQDIAAIYKGLFPYDTVIVGDAHQYLLEHYKEFDFIWSSPPCPTHSVSNNFLNAQGVIRYPDMKLWQEIAFLRQFFRGKFVVENVRSYYDPLWTPVELDRHYFWANFPIAPFETPKRDFNITNGRASTRNSPHEEIALLSGFHGINLSNSIRNSRLLLRNCVYPPLGKHILACAMGEFRPKPLPLFPISL